MQDFFLSHMFLVFFIYGLSFFLLGFAITLQVRRYLKSTELSLGRSLWFLAAFGITHGFAEWFTLFLIMDGPNFSLEVRSILNILDNFIMALSFLCLYIFGVSLAVLEKPKLSWFKAAPFISFMGWIGIVTYSMSLSSVEAPLWIEVSKTIIRLFLAIPGGLFSAYALYLQYRDLRTQGYNKVSKNFLVSAWVIVGYSLLAGLVFNSHSFFVNFLPTEKDFMDLFGLPVQFARATCAGLLAYYMIKGLDVFYEESQQRLEQVEKERLLYQERGRIGRDLHDGIIQSIYGVGLNLENIIYLVDESPSDAKKQLNNTMSKLNMIVKDIRQYILGLSPADFEETDLVKGTQAFLDKFRANTLLQVDFDIYGKPRQILNTHQCNNYYHILQEVLNNIFKHAEASLVEVSLAFKDTKVELVIWDNGIGFEYKKINNNSQNQGEKQGLKNLQERAELLGGTLKIKSWPKKGSIVRLTIPERSIKDGEDNKDSFS